MIGVASDIVDLAISLSGKYSSVSLIFAPCDGTGCLHEFSVTASSNRYLEKTMTNVLCDLNSVDFLELSVDQDEYLALLTTCRACVQVKKAYNYRDMLLLNVPFREPVEKDCMQPKPSLMSRLSS
jgi:hypothetical protein